MFVRPGREGRGNSRLGQARTSRVEVLPYLVDAKEELEQTDEECFSWATAKLALGENTVEEYFDYLIGHIRQGGPRHTWDKSKSSIEDALDVDMIAGAFKSRMLKRNLGRISHTDGEQLKALCLLFYREAELAELLRRIELDIGVTLASLSPWIINILGMITYARRHADALEHLVKNYRASSKSANSTFDLLGSAILWRRRGPNRAFQHSPDTIHNCELEWRMWTVLLNAEPGTWLHYPLRQINRPAGIPEGLFHGMHHLANCWAEDHQLRSSPLFVEYLDALKLRGVFLDASTISRFLSITEGCSINFTRGGPFVPVTVGLARTILDRFPLEQWLSANYRGHDSALVAMPITQWPTDNPDRLVVMETLLEQGLVVDGRLSEDRAEPLGPREYEDQKFDTCLILAAGRGDAKMVDLLLEYGAKRNVRDARGRIAAERARESGHTELAQYLNSL